jgi:hypothetical protein
LREEEEEERPTVSVDAVSAATTRKVLIRRVIWPTESDRARQEKLSQIALAGAVL